MEAPKTITLDGVSHDVTRFSQPVQNAISVYNTFNAQLQTEQLAVMKTQAALQSIGSQIAEAVKKELEEQSAAEPAAEVKAAE